MDFSKYFIVTDMDGTFLPDNKKINQTDLQKVREFEKCGGKFTIATGRTLQSVSNYIDVLKPNMPVIMYNGSVIYDFVEQRVLYSVALPESIVNFVKEVIEEIPEIACEILRLDNIYIVRDNIYEQNHTKICNVKPVYCDIEEVPKGEWLKILFAMGSKEMDRFEKFISEREVEGVYFVRSSEHYYEILPANSSKGAALKEYVKLLGLEDKYIISAGDFYNDIEMIEFADLGTATANAQEEVKDKADMVLKSDCNSCPMSEIIEYISENM